MAQVTTKTNGQAPTKPSPSDPPVAVNKKKAKRRQKAAEAAAKLAATGQIHASTNGASRLSPEDEYEQYDLAEADRPYYSDEADDGYSDTYGQSESVNGYLGPSPSSRSSKKKKRKGQQHEHPAQSRTVSGSNISMMPPTTMSKEKIWNTSSTEERERIKAFWLSLGEEDRRSLVKVEKDAVLKKMKEQQKHSCSCTVCGRKRIAIEEELEVLYDAYYDELEQYAHRQGSGPPPMLSGSQRFGQISGLQPPNQLPSSFDGSRPSRGRITEHFDNEEEGEEAYSDDPDVQDEEDYSDEEIVSQFPPNHASDFFNFGQSLTVKGGILTVADDLLKNDGKKFIEMMEQLAERRMAREEDAREQYGNGYGHPANGLPIHNHSHGHNHPPIPEDDDYDSQEEDDEEYEEEDEDYDEEEMDTMTEEQRMEEGRRMFQIFAARMFEQRVLSAYKEKVAAERQYKLIQEEDEEANAAEAKKAKKARDAAKKKEKAQAKKLALAEEKAKRDAEKAAQEAAIREAEAKKAEEQRQKAEEKRKKREAQKKAEEEERVRKEFEKAKRLQEQREREAELQRKAREAKERERKEKEEARLKEKELREAKEKESRERKEKLEKEKRESESKAKPLADRSKAQDQPPPAVPTQIHKRPTPQASIPLSHNLTQQPPTASPQIAVATPVISKAPTPQRQASISQKESVFIPQTPQVPSTTSSNTSPHSSTPQHSSPAPPNVGRTSSQPYLHHPQATSPMHSALKPNTFSQGPFAGMQPLALNGFQQGMQMMGPGFGGRMHHDPMSAHQQQLGGSQFRSLVAPNGIPQYPGINGMPMPQGRGFPAQHGPPGFQHHMSNPGPSQFVSQHENVQSSTHSRQQSGSIDKSAFETASPAPTQPIARPAPIGHSSSGQRNFESGHGGRSDVDDLSNHLGSSALLDDSDEPLGGLATRRASAAPGGLSRQGGFPQSVPFGMDPAGFGGMNYSGGWGAPLHGNLNPFGASSLPGSTYMGGWSNPQTFGGNPSMNPSSNMRSNQPRSVAVRLMLCNACRHLEGSTPDGFHSISAVRDQIERMNNPAEVISEKELLDLCETEGSSHNGGGFFDVRSEPNGQMSIRYEPDLMSQNGSGRPIGAPGEIGSPVVGHGQVHRGFGMPPGLPAHSSSGF